MSMRGLHALVLTACVGMLANGRAVAQEQQGSITGRITDAATREPIPAAQVNVVGTTAGGEMKRVAFSEGDIEAQTIRRYRPGSEP